jgi:hypothetical protein
MRIWPEYGNGQGLPDLPVHRPCRSRLTRPRWIIASLHVASGMAIAGEFPGAYTS